MQHHHSFKNILDKNEDNNNIILSKQKKGKNKKNNIVLKTHTTNITRRNKDLHRRDEDKLEHDFV